MKLISVAEIRKGDKIRSERAGSERVESGAALLVEYIASKDQEQWFVGGTYYLVERASKFPHEVGTLILVKGRMPLYRDHDELWHFVNALATQTFTDKQLEEAFADKEFVVLWSQDEHNAPFED